MSRRLFEVDPKWWTPAELRRVWADLYRELARRTNLLFAKSEGAGTERKLYRDPDNQFNTWRGRGARPKWLKNHLESGKTLEEMEQPNEHNQD